MIFLQKIYLSLLNPVGRITGRIDDRIRNFIIYLLSCVLMCSYLLWHSFRVVGVSTTKNNEMLIGSLLLAGIIIISIKAKLQIVGWKRAISFSLFVCGILMILVSFLHPIGAGFRATALIWAIGFPCFYFVWGNRGDYHTIYITMAKAFSHILGIYFLICIINFPIGENGDFGGRYIGTTANPNIFGMLCAAAAISALYLIFITRTKTAWIYILIVGLSALCALYSESRTALLAIAIDSILFIIYYVRHKILKHDKKVEKSIILLLTCAVLIGAVFVIPYVSSHTDTVEAAVNKDKICQTSQTMTAQLDQTPLDRFETHEVDLNSFASSRFTVWKNYLENLNLIGHNGNKLLYIKDGYDKREWAHNTALEIAYRCGVIPGILFLLIEVYAGIYVLIWLFSKKYEPWRLFSMMGIITFCLYSVLDVVVYPFEHVIMFLFFIAIMPLFKKEKKVHE